MSNSVHKTDGSSAAQTVTLNEHSSDDSLSLELRERMHRIPSCIALLDTPAAGSARMNQQVISAATKPYKKYRRLTVGYFSTDKPGVDVPYVRLFGRWMQDAGFVIGRHVKVEVSEGRLMIEQVD